MSETSFSTPYTPPPGMATPQFKHLLDQCIHCGLCLQNCPTYVLFGTETDSPRGRIQLMRAASQGRIELGRSVSKHIDLCLNCRSCETACPSGVQYGALVETTRLILEKKRTQSWLERIVRRVGLVEMMPHVNRLRFLARLFRLYQVFKIQDLVRAVNLLPKNLKAMEAILPPLPASYFDYRTPAPAIGEKRGTVAFFYGCLQDAFLGDVNKATIRVLQRNGYEVHFPLAQTCCGAAHWHTGEDEQTRDLARRNIDAFLGSSPVADGGGKGGGNGYDAIINNAGGCGAALKEYPHILQDDATYTDKAKLFVSKVQDISEFLAQHLNRAPQGVVNARVTYSDSCHLRNAQKIVKQPRDLLKKIPGIQFVEMAYPDRCCGSAGVYNLVQPDAATEILDTRMQDIANTGAEIIVTTNTGCHLQLIQGVRRSKLNARVMHLVELLDESYEKERNT